MHRLPQLAAVGLLGLFLSSGCTSGPRPQPISWKPVVGSAGNPPVVRPDGLVLEGQPIRTAAVYRGPVTVECDLVLLEANGATAGVTLVLVPAEGDPVQVPVDWGTAPLQLKAGQPYRLRFDLFGEVRVRVNGLELDIPPAAVPRGPFHLQLSVRPTRSRWHLQDLWIQ